MSTPQVEPFAATPKYGWHVPVRTDIPDVVADLSALANGIESVLWNVTAGSYMAIKITADSASIASGPMVKIACTAIENALGPDLSFTGGRIDILNPGLYQVGGLAKIGPRAAGAETNGYVHKANSAGTVTNSMVLGGGAPTSAVTYDFLAGSYYADLVAGEQLHLGAYAGVAGAVMKAGSLIWALRIG
jgi:hypothetical protein